MIYDPFVQCRISARAKYLHNVLVSNFDKMESTWMTLTMNKQQRERKAEPQNKSDISIKWTRKRKSQFIEIFAFFAAISRFASMDHKLSCCTVKIKLNSNFKFIVRKSIRHFVNRKNIELTFGLMVYENRCENFILHCGR